MTGAGNDDKVAHLADILLNKDPSELGITNRSVQSMFVHYRERVRAAADSNSKQ